MVGLLSLLAKTVLTVFTLYILSCVYNFVRNILLARRTGLKYIVTFVNQDSVPWVVLSSPNFQWLKRTLPTIIWRRICMCIYGWEYHEGVKPFEEFCQTSTPSTSAINRNDNYEKSFILSGTGNIELWTIDPEFASEILRRPDDFKQQVVTQRILSTFGDNVFTTGGQTWTRHRKIVASVINERISKSVWDESVTQTKGMLKEILTSSSSASSSSSDNTIRTPPADEVPALGTTNQIPEMLKKCTVNVLSGAGMGTHKSWADDTDEEVSPGYKQTYIECVKTVLRGVAGLILLPPWFMRFYPGFLPGYATLKAFYHAQLEFPKHTQAMLDAERERLKGSPEDVKHNILSQLITASSKEKKDSALSDAEMRGNLFVFTTAGFETTANTLTYAFVMLARYPEWQEWLCEEIDELLPLDSADEEDQEIPDYTTTFPKAQRTMAFLLETLRLFPPLIHINKSTSKEVTLRTSTGTYWLPADITIYVHVVGLHRNPAIWRNLNIQKGESPSEQDEHIFRPTRWLNPEGAPHPLFQPPTKGVLHYMPWSAGPRVCPGQKMAQVEFTAIFLTLLRRHRVGATMDKGMSREDVNSILDAQMRDSHSVVTLQMNGVYDVDAKEVTKGLRLQVERRR